MSEKAGQEYGSRYPHWGWCWVCKREVPLLDDRSATELDSLLKAFIKDVQAYRGAHRASLEQAYKAVACPVVDRYRELTGDDPVTEGDAEHSLAFHLVDHRPGHFGPPCWNCGRLLRTPGAGYCPECMASRKKGKFEKTT